MAKRIRVKPSKAQSAVGMAGGVIFCLIGLAVVIPIFGLFGIAWTAIAVIITITNAVNLFTEKGIASREIYIDEEENSERENASPRGTKKNGEAATGDTTADADEIGRRLDAVKNLYEQGLITKEEYDKKREEILKEL